MSASAALDFSHCEAQTLAYQAIHPGVHLCNAWGRGVGKSWFLRMAIYLIVAQHDGRMRMTIDGPLYGVRIILLYPTLAQFKRIGMAQSLREELAPTGKFGFLGARINRSEWRVTFPGGSWIQVVSADSVDNNRGIRTDVLAADECDDISPIDYESVCIPWFSNPWSLRIRIMTGTPRRGRNGLLWRGYRVWPRGDAKRAAIPGHVSTFATYKQAPAIVSRETVEEARRSMSPERFAREWECDFDSGEGLVYPQLSAELHVREPDYGVGWSEILVGVDHGMRDPGVILVGGVIGQGRDAVVHLLEEIYETDQATTWWCNKAADVAWRYRAHRQRWYGDPSRPDRIIDIRRAVREQHPQLAERFTIDPGDNDIEAGVDAVADRLSIEQHETAPDVVEQRSRLYVSPACVYTLDEFGKYRRKKDPHEADRFSDEIQDKNNHAMDALRYMVFTRFGGPDRTRHEIGPQGPQYATPA